MIDFSKPGNRPAIVSAYADGFRLLAGTYIILRGSNMALTKEKTSALVSAFGANEKDTGNVKVQVAILTERIKQLTEHCKNLQKDKSASRGLLKLVGQRRKLLKYMQRTDLEGYRALIKELGLRK